MRQSRRVLVATWDGAGNIPPIVSLAGALTGRGDEVHVAGHESTRNRFEAAGCSFIAWPGSSQPLFIREYMPPEEEYAYAAEHIFFGQSYRTDLRPVIEELAPDVLMVDVNLRYGILEGLRVAQPLVILCHFLYGVAMEFRDEASPYFSSLAATAVGDGVPAFSSKREMMDLADLILVFTYADFDLVSGGDVGENVVHVGPLRDATFEPSGWVRRHPDRRLVVIGMSTSDQNQGRLLKQLCDACATLDVEALVTTGPTVDPVQLATPNNVTAVEFIHHDEVLPGADLLITHAGHGTVAAGLTYGVPMLCIPLGRDQPFNANRVEALGLGSAMEPDASVAELRTAMRDLLDDEGVRRKARLFRDHLKNHPGIHDALHAIDATLPNTPPH